MKMQDFLFWLAVEGFYQELRLRAMRTEGRFLTRREFVRLRLAVLVAPVTVFVAPVTVIWMLRAGVPFTMLNSAQDVPAHRNGGGKRIEIARG